MSSEAARGRSEEHRANLLARVGVRPFHEGRAGEPAHPGQLIFGLLAFGELFAAELLDQFVRAGHFVRGDGKRLRIWDATLAFPASITTAKQKPSMINPSAVGKAERREGGLYRA